MNRVKELEGQLEEANAKAHHIEGQSGDFEKQISNLKGELEAKKDEFANIQKEVEERTKKNDELNEDYDKLKKEYELYKMTCEQDNVRLIEDLKSANKLKAEQIKALECEIQGMHDKIEDLKKESEGLKAQHDSEKDNVIKDLRAEIDAIHEDKKA